MVKGLQRQSCMADKIFTVAGSWFLPLRLPFLCAYFHMDFIGSYKLQNWEFWRYSYKLSLEKLFSLSLQLWVIPMGKKIHTIYSCIWSVPLNKLKWPSNQKKRIISSKSNLIKDIYTHENLCIGWVITILYVSTVHVIWELQNTSQMFIEFHNTLLRYIKDVMDASAPH